MRNTLKALALTILLALGLCPFAQATEGPLSIALKDKAFVNGDAILLSDVATLPDGASDALKQISIGNAPTPGHNREVSRMLVKVRMISCGWNISLVAFSGSDVCDVAVQSTWIKPADIVAEARRHLASYFPTLHTDGGQVGSGDVEINLANESILRDMNPVCLPAAAHPPELRASVPQGTPTAGNVKVDVEIIQDGVVIRKIPVAFNLKLYKEVLVAQTAVAAGQTLTTENVALSRRELSEVHGACFDSVDAALGKVASVALQPAQVITSALARAPEPPVVIEPNQSVFLIVQTETLKVVTLGTALGRARRGQVARAKNISTGREVLGVAGDDSTIHVLLGGPTDVH